MKSILLLTNIYLHSGQQTCDDGQAVNEELWRRDQTKKRDAKSAYKNTCKKRPTFRRGKRCDIHLYHSFSPYKTSAAGYHCWPMMNTLHSTITNLQECFQRVVQNAMFLVLKSWVGLYRKTLNTRGQDRFMTNMRITHNYVIKLKTFVFAI